MHILYPLQFCGEPLQIITAFEVFGTETLLSAALQDTTFKMVLATFVEQPRGLVATCFYLAW